MTLTLDQQCNLDRLIEKRYHTARIAELSGIPADDVHEYRVARKKARHGARHDREKPLEDPLLPALKSAGIIHPGNAVGRLIGIPVWVGSQENRNG